MKLIARRVGVYYGAVSAVREVSLDIPDRTITALIGPSGCGKSTFLRSLNRLHDLVPDVRVQGQILLDGRDVRQMAPEEVRCRIGMLFQRPNPFPFSIYENVAFGPSLFGVRGRALDRIVSRCLDQAALWPEVRQRLSADARSLSGGQQQRLCLARALALEPEVLLMDEPCSALDPSATHAIEELMLRLRQKMTLVIVTHSVAQAKRVADRAAFFHAGALVEVGEAKQVLSHPREEKTAQFLAAQAP